MEIIYEKTEEDEGNDCKIYKSSFIVRVTDDCFLASKCTVYRGWMGTQIDSQSSTFEDEEDAMNYVKK